MITTSKQLRPVLVAAMPEARPAPKGDHAVIRLVDGLDPVTRDRLVADVVTYACRIRETRPPEYFIDDDQVLRVELPRGWRQGRTRALFLRLALAKLCGACGYASVDQVIIERRPW